MGYSPASAIPLSAFGVPVANIPMNTHKFTSLLDGSTALDSAGWDQLPTSSGQYAYVVSGCVWTADAPASTRNASMSAGTVVIGGLLYTVAAITAHTFTASSDTYVDINLSGGATQVVFTTVANNTISPALPSAGIFSNTIRNAIVITTASAITSTVVSINQNNPQFVTATAQGSSTVAAGSNGQQIGALTSSTLDVAASTSFPSGGGYAQVATSGNTAVISFTGTGTGTLTGVTLLGGVSANTVSTGGAVTGVTPLTVTDMIGNLINANGPYPRVIAYQQFVNSFTTTQTTLSLVTPLNVIPFIIPAGPATREIKMVCNCPFLASSAAAGNTVGINVYTANLTAGIGSANGKMSVASDGWPVNVSGIGGLAPGTYYGTVGTQAGAAGTTTVSATYQITAAWIELV